MPFHLRDGFFVSLDHVIGFTKLFQESNEVLLGFTLELTHKRLKFILLHTRPLMFINAIHRRRTPVELSQWQWRPRQLTHHHHHHHPHCTLLVPPTPWEESYW